MAIRITSPCKPCLFQEDRRANTPVRLPSASRSTQRVSSEHSSKVTGHRVVLEAQGQDTGRRQSSSCIIPQILQSTPVEKVVMDVLFKPAILPSLGTTVPLSINKRPTLAEKSLSSMTCLYSRNAPGIRATSEAAEMMECAEVRLGETPELQSTPVEKVVMDVLFKPAILPSLGTTVPLSINKRPTLAEKSLSSMTCLYSRNAPGVRATSGAAEMVKCAEVRLGATSEFSSIHELVEEAHRIARVVDEIKSKKGFLTVTGVTGVTRSKSGVGFGFGKRVKLSKSKSSVGVQSDRLAENEKLHCLGDDVFAEEQTHHIAVADMAVDSNSEDKFIEEALARMSAIEKASCEQKKLQPDTRMAQTSDNFNSDSTLIAFNVDQLEDSLSVVAHPVVLSQRPNHRQTNEVEPLGRSQEGLDAPQSQATWTVVDKSVHHFCILPNCSQLSQVYRGLWRPYHTGLKELQGQRLNAFELEDTTLKSQREIITSNVDCGTVEDTHSQKENLEVKVEKIELSKRHLNMYWTPVPPKWDFAPAQVKSVLFPEYHGAEYVADGYEMNTFGENTSGEDSCDDEDRQARDSPVIQRREFRARVNSVDNISSSARLPSWLSNTDAAGRPTAGTPSLSTTDAAGRPTNVCQLASQTQQLEKVSVFSKDDNLEHSKQVKDSEMITPIRKSLQGLKRSRSAPGGLDADEDFLLIYQNFQSLLSELARQRAQIEALGKPLVETVVETVVEPGNIETPLLADGNASSSVSEFNQPDEEKFKPGLPHKCGAKRHCSWKKFKLLEDKDRFDIASMSAPLVASSSPTCRSSPLTTPRTQRLTSRRLSVPDKLQFQEYKTIHRYDAISAPNEREWVRDIWNTWFDIVFPPTPRVSTSPVPMTSSVDVESVETSGPPPLAKLTVYSEDIEIPPSPELITEEVELLRGQVDRLTSEISAAEGQHRRAFDLCRRGAILRRLGNIKAAYTDINAAIAIEPSLVDAYWQRHLVNILLNRQTEAIDDLNSLLKLNKTHVPALKSRGLLYVAAGETILSLNSFNLAQEYAPTEWDVYLHRAQVYERTGQPSLALKDYETCTSIDPNNCDALLKYAMLLFKQRYWQLALRNLDHVLRLDRLHAEARYYRALVRTELRQWNLALEDFTTAIHLDPSNANAFYHRGCLLRKSYPKKALQDLSVSLLIDSSHSNISCYLQRGLLYSELAMPREAIADLERVVEVQPKPSSTLVKLGLIHLQQLRNYKRAAKYFTDAIRADPTNCKAFMCRIDAYRHLHKFQSALGDVTRLIHMRPDVTQFYVLRVFVEFIDYFHLFAHTYRQKRDDGLLANHHAVFGDIVRKMGRLKLASFCIEQLAERNDAVGRNPMQQAIVYNFLKNYDQAVAVLEDAVNSSPSVAVLSMLGDTYMKSGLWQSAILNFSRASNLFTQEMPTVALAKIHFKVGTCQVELNQFEAAINSFTNALKNKARDAEAFHWRGVAKLKMGNPKGIRDVNSSLAINPCLFQAYLSRASFYGLQGKYSKAILNCNEALRLKPSSVRAHLYRGALKYHIRAFRLAIRDLDHALGLDNTCRLAYYNRALCRQATGDIPKAVQDFSVVLMLGNADNDANGGVKGQGGTEEQLTLAALINRSLLYVQLGGYANAMQDLKWASKLSPTDKCIHQALGVCHYKLGHVQDSVRSFTEALKLDRFFTDALIGRGNAFIDYGNELGHVSARRDYQRALHHDPTCLVARVNLAHCLQVSGRFMQAWLQFTAALAIDPRFLPALEGRAVVNLQMSNIFAANQDMSAAIAVQPTAELLTNRGVIHQFQNDVVNAMRDFKRAIQVDPNYSLSYFNAANLYLYNQQFRQAEQYFSLALKHNAQDESAYLNRAICKVMLKDTQGGLEDFSAALLLSPFSAHIYFNRGNLYASMNMLEEAERDYTRAIQLDPSDALALIGRAAVRAQVGNHRSALDDHLLAIDIQSRPIVQTPATADNEHA